MWLFASVRTSKPATSRIGAKRGRRAAERELLDGGDAARRHGRLEVADGDVGAAERRADERPRVRATVRGERRPDLLAERDVADCIQRDGTHDERAGGPERPGGLDDESDPSRRARDEAKAVAAELSGRGRGDDVAVGAEQDAGTRACEPADGDCDTRRAPVGPASSAPSTARR